MKPFFLVFIALLTAGLFIGGPGYYDSPVIRELWESGHFVLFLFLSFYLSTHSKLNRIEELKRSTIILVLLFLFGLLTETAQLFVGRNFEVNDLLSDMLGAMAGLLIPHLSFKTHSGRGVLLVSLFIFLIFFSQRRLLSTVLEEVKLHQEFPVLADFETPNQLELWSNNQSKRSLSDSIVRNGRFSMCVELSPGKYPGFTLWRLHRNWQGYQFIQFSIYLDEEYPINLIMKVYDWLHPYSGYNNYDRFHSALSLKPGWNDFKLPLKQIESAPAGRSMDMTEIVNLNFFTVDLKQTITLYIDSVQLVNE